MAGVGSGCAAIGRTWVVVCGGGWAVVCGGGWGGRVGECVGSVAWGVVSGSMACFVVRNRAPGTAVPFGISGIEEAVVGVGGGWSCSGGAVEISGDVSHVVVVIVVFIGVGGVGGVDGVDGV